jgi:ABC-type xylose transport system permease subunit
MTRRTNARVAGFTFLLYIAVAFPAMVLLGKATHGNGVAAKLAGIARHAGDVRVVVVLSLLSALAALVLAVTLYAITRDEDADLAMLGLTCRVGEGVLGGVSILVTMGLLWLGTSSGADAPDPAAANALGAFLLKVNGWSTSVGATFFAVGSTLFAWLFLRGRIVPLPLAWLGLVASVLVVVGLPAQLLGLITGPAADLYMWLPMLAFEVTLALWLIFKGARMPVRQARPATP